MKAIQQPNMNRNLLTAIFLLLSSLLAACSNAGTETSGNAAQAPAANTGSQASSANGNASASSLPADVLLVDAPKVEVEAGKSTQANVKLKIKEGYHINANPPSQYQIATQLTVEQSDGITAGQAKYPASLTRKFSFSEEALAVYEKEATISVPLSAQAGAMKGERSIPARVRFQACDDQVCYPPKNLQVSIPVLVK
ncbi:MAG TPA: protein-disulfide reductase DsbD N-terminal domain-containing protein [Pyrinomonadaceae bacterium]|nr:protein-disulfide reductase DsbD N-terminal domain-containing protein [Pyrinomonadaceae bacterium]